MYENTSESYKSRVKEPGRTFKARLVNGADVISDICSISIFSAENGSDDVGLGGAVASYIECKILNTDIALEGVEFDLEIGLELDEGFEYVPMGKYMPKRPTIGELFTNFTAYDRIYTAFSTGYFTSITEYPVDAKAILAEIETLTGITINYSTLPDGVMVDKRMVIVDNSADGENNVENNTYANPFEGYTYQETLCYIAQLFGKFAIMNRNGEVDFRWFEESGLSYSRSQYKGDITRGESDFVLGCLQCSVGEETFTVGAGSSGISIENPIMTKERLTAVYNQLSGFTSRETTATTIGDLCIDVGDIISVQIGTEYVKVPVMKTQLYFDGGIKSVLYAFGKIAEVEEKKGPTTQRLDRMYSELLLVKEVTASKISADYADLKYATITNLNAIKAQFNELSAKSITTDNLSAKVADLGYLTADSADLRYATIDNLSVLQGSFNVLNAKAITTDNLTAKVAELGYVTAETVETNYLKSDKASFATMLAGVGLITTAVIENGHVTGSLDSVSVNANNITAGTLSVDRLVIRGTEKSLVYAINNITGALQAQNVNTINGETLTPRTINADRIVAGSITADEIAAGTIIASKIASGAITSDKIEAGAVTAVKISSNAVIAEKIASGAITSDKIEAGAVTAVKISSNAVIASKIASGAITTEKLSAGAVTADKVTTGAISAEKIAAGAVTADKLSVDNLSAISADLGKVTAGSISIVYTDETNPFTKLISPNGELYLYPSYLSTRSGSTTTTLADMLTISYGNGSSIGKYSYDSISLVSGTNTVTIDATTRSIDALTFTGTSAKATADANGVDIRTYVKSVSQSNGAFTFSNGTANTLATISASTLSVLPLSGGSIAGDLTVSGQLTASGSIVASTILANSDLYISKTTGQGIVLTSDALYPKRISGVTLALGTSSNRFQSGYITTLNSTTINADKIQLYRKNGINYGRISYYDAAYYTWYDYMSNPVVGACPTGGTPSIYGDVTSWAKRTLIESTSGFGWIWEATKNSRVTSTSETPTPIMSLSSATGKLTVKGTVVAPTFNGKLIGNATTATKATQDASGNVITSTYATKTELESIKTGETWYCGGLATSTSGYYKFLSITLSKYEDFNMTLIANSDYSAICNGILKLHFRSENGASLNTTTSIIQWLNRIGWEEDVVIGVVAGTTVDFYIKSTLSAYNGITFTMLTKSSFSGDTMNYTLYNSEAPTGEELTATFTSVDRGIVKAAIDADKLTLYRVTQDANVMPGTQRVRIREYTNGSSNIPAGGFYHILSCQSVDSNYATQLALGMTDKNLYVRWKQAGTFSDWCRYVRDADLTAFVSKTSGMGEMLSNYSVSDINSISGTKIVYVTSSSTQKPDGTDHALFQMAYSDVWKTQLAHDWRTNNLYTRVCSNGTWSTWKTILDSGNYTSYCATSENFNALYSEVEKINDSTIPNIKADINDLEDEIASLRNQIVSLLTNPTVTGNLTIVGGALVAKDASGNSTNLYLNGTSGPYANSSGGLYARTMYAQSYEEL